MKVFVRDMTSDKIPWGPLIACCFVTFLDSFCLQLVTPNLPFMIKDFYPDVDDTELGYYSGYLTAAFSIGQIPGNLFWGWYSDKVGRRNCFLTCLFFVFFITNAFGLSPNYPVALIFRTLWGFFNGNIGAAKTYISEICNPKTQALGFSLFTTTMGISNVVGPTLGGILSKPEENMPWLVDLIPNIHQYRFYIPCFVSGILIVIIFIEVLIFLPETLSKEQRTENSKMKKETHKSIQEVLDKKAKNPNYKPTEHEIELSLWKNDNYFYFFTKKDVMITCVFYFMISLIQAAQDCYLSSGNSLSQILSSPMLLPSLTILLNYTSIYRYTFILYGILLFCQPIIGLMSYSDRWLQWLTANFFYSCSMGIRVLAAIGRSFGPIVCTSIFAWSLQDTNVFPFDYGFVFYILGLLSILTSLLAYKLNRNINAPPNNIKTEAHEIYISQFTDIELKQLNESSIDIKEEKKESNIVIQQNGETNSVPQSSNEIHTPHVSNVHDGLEDDDEIITPNNNIILVTPNQMETNSETENNARDARDDDSNMNRMNSLPPYLVTAPNTVSQNSTD
ncbi:hypothetical protein WA158_002641 [Blastocystis sp. Blastoise]